MQLLGNKMIQRTKPNTDFEATMRQAQEMALISKQAVKDRNDDLLKQKKKERKERDERHFTLVDAYDFLGGKVNKTTISNYLTRLGIDFYRFQDEGAKWLIDINDMYKLQDALDENGFPIFPKGWREPKKYLQTVAVVSQKGGVGKTVCTVNVAAAAAMNVRYGRLRVGVIDMDSQATTSMYFAPDFCVNDDNTTSSAAELVMGEFDLIDGETVTEHVSRSFLPTSIPNLRILPAYRGDKGMDNIVNRKVIKNELENPYELLKNYIDMVSDEFDLIFIDTPPAMNYYTYNAMFAATSMYIPVSPTPNDLDATYGWLGSLPTAFETLHQFGFEGLVDDMKIMVTNYDKVGDSSSHNTYLLKDKFPKYVLPIHFMKSEAIRTCGNSLSTVYDISKSEYGGGSKQSFTNCVSGVNQFVDQIMERINKNWK